MALINVEHNIGDKVTHFTGVEGMITAVRFTGLGVQYEMSYYSGSSDPACIHVNPCEIKSSGNNPFGFASKKKAQ